jgi:hypothetical protein
MRTLRLAIPLVLVACGNGQDGTAPTSGIATVGSSASSDSSGDATDGGTGHAKLDLGPAGEVTADTTDEPCAAQTIEAEVSYAPVDILLVIDTSWTMESAIDSVEATINDNFAQIMEDSGLDYRVIVAAEYAPSEFLDVCITSPLSATDCNPPPPAPAVTEHYLHYDQFTGSGAYLDNIVAWFSAPDQLGLAPNGYSEWLRPDAQKIILAMTDGTGASGGAEAGDAFDAQLLSLQPGLFGTQGDRRYVFHTIIAMSPNDPVTAPWLPADPIQGEGASIQQVSIISGGWRFPLSEYESFDVVFDQIAQGVVQMTPIECAFPIPVPEDGGTIDPDTIEIDYLPQGAGPATIFHQVPDLAACEPNAFYIMDASVQLCPETCALVQADVSARLDVRYGCDVGYVPPA